MKLAATLDVALDKDEHLTLVLRNMEQEIGPVLETEVVSTGDWPRVKFTITVEDSLRDVLAFARMYAGEHAEAMLGTLEQFEATE